MKVTLIKTIYGEDSELYVTKSGRRIAIAKGTSIIEIYEHSNNINILGKTAPATKKMPALKILCNNFDFNRNLDDKYLSTVSGFDLKTDIQRTDGIFERIIFNSLSNPEIEEDSNLIFNFYDNVVIKKLINI